jgi:hypothetical protein
LKKDWIIFRSAGVKEFRKSNFAFCPVARKAGII